MDTFNIAISFVISTIVVGVLLLPGIRVGLNIGDEAYLHFGSVRLLEGKIPILDFRAYDPGRYYWVALWMRFLGPTFVTQRLAMGFIMIMSLTMTCSWVFYISQSWAVAVSGMLISFIWMRPYYRAFEILFSLIAVTVSFCIITDPGPANYLVSGFMVGIALFFGLNISLYTGLSVLLALAVSFALQHERSITPLTWVMVGFMLGIGPILLLGFRKPGYFSTYWKKKVLTVLDRGTSNLPLPLPWIWTEPAQLQNLSPARQFFFKAVFTGLVPFYLLSFGLGSFAVGFGLVGVYSTTGGLIMSAGLTGLVYLHYLFARADIPHMSPAIHPGLLLVSILSATFLPWHWATLLLGVIGALSAWAILPRFSIRFNFICSGKNFVDYDTGREILTLVRSQAETFKALKHIINVHSTEGDFAFFAPSAPGFYQLFNRQPALYDIYCVYPETTENQSRMIESLGEQQTQIVIIDEQPIDQNDKLRFSKTHTQVWHYLHSHFDLLENERLPRRIKVFTKCSREKVRPETGRETDLSHELRSWEG